MQTGTTASLLEHVHQYRLDAAFVGKPFASDSLNAKLAFKEELVLITARQRRSIASAVDLFDDTIFAFAQGCSYRRILEESILDAEISLLRIAEFPSYHAIIACAAAGSGCGIVPVSVLSTLSAGRNVRPHALPKAIATSCTYLIWRDDATPGVLALLDHLPDAS